MSTTPLSPADVTTTVTEIVAAELGVEPDQIDTSTDLRSVEGMDSLKVLRMIARIEKLYDIELEDDVIFSLERVDELSAAITAARAQ